MIGLWGRRLFAGLMAALLASCGPPETDKAVEAAIKQLPRASIATPEASGGVLSYLHSGDPAGRRVIFIHGTPGSATGFGEYLLHPPPGFEYLSVDRPGFGQSGPAGAVPSLKDQAAAIAPLLVERNGQWPLLVGHSLGGPIVAQLAADDPDRVGGLVILAGSLDPGLEHTQWVQYVAATWPFRAVLPRMLRNTNKELMELKPHLAALEPRLADIRCPVIVVHGTKDNLVPYANVPYIQKHMVNVARLDVVTLPGQNHFLPWLHQKAVKDAIATLAAEPATSCADTQAVRPEATAALR